MTHVGAANTPHRLPAPLHAGPPRLGAVLACVLAVTACVERNNEGSTGDAAQRAVTDAGPADATAGGEDSGVAPDSGVPTDAGIPTDAGTAADAGLAIILCDSIHAAKIARDYRLPGCDAPNVINDFSAHASAGAGLADSFCNQKTPNQCAQHFRDNPANGLIDNGASATRYRAFHFSTGPDDPLMPDGTRPLLYYKEGSGEHINDWIIFLQGGANMCTTSLVQPTQRQPPDNVSRLSTLGLECFGKMDYSNQAETAAGTGFNRQKWKDLSSVGILGEAAVNPDFHAYNRVYITKPNDGWVGGATWTNVDVIRGGVGARWQVATMQTRGDEIVRKAMAFLANSGGATNDFNAAENVLFVASSTGVNAVQRVDDWRDAVIAHTTVPPDDYPAYVGMMVNSQIMLPDALVFEDNDDSVCGSIYRRDCPGNYDEPPAGRLPYRLGPGSSRYLTFSNSAWLDYQETTFLDSSSPLAPGEDWAQYQSVAARLDTSCVALELQYPWRCRSRQYVMLNHLATPLFMAHSYHDGSNSKINTQLVRLEDGAIPTWDNVKDAFPGERPLETVTRDLLNKYVDNRDNPAPGGAAGASKNAGPLGVWASDCEQHEPEKHADHFSNGAVQIGVPIGNMLQVTLSAALKAWFESRVEVVRIDGRGDSNTLYPMGAPPQCQMD